MVHNQSVQPAGKCPVEVGKLEMKKRYAISLAISIYACLCFSACAVALPAASMAAAVELRTSGGWWIRINNDGSGRYGFGELPDYVKIANGTFAFGEILDDISRALPRKPKNAEAPYVAVSFWKEGSYSAEEHLVAMNNTLLTKLFISARNNTVPPANEFEKIWYDNIESFWLKNPPISTDRPGAD